jgi:7-cyano-7-deazaguanine synthase
MDSCVTTAHAIKDGHTVYALHVNYGQRTQDRELKAFHDICDHYTIEHRLVVDISHLAAIGGSSLTDKTMQMRTVSSEQQAPSSEQQTQSSEQRTVSSEQQAASSEQRGEIPNTYVPFRNANILAIATSWAEVVETNHLYIGAVEEDSSGYPDCRDVFFRAFEEVIRTGTKPGTTITIETPLIHLTKGQIVRSGIELQAPLHLSWSCYRNEDEACGTCDSCVLRLRGFDDAHVEDPIAYVGR